MKRILYLALSIGMAIGANAQNGQVAQLVPDVVNLISVDGRHSLRIVAGDETLLEAPDGIEKIARIRGNKLIVSGDKDADVTLVVGPSRDITIHTEDYATVVVWGALPMRTSISVAAEDFSTVMFDGSVTDTVSCTNLTLRSEDYSRISSNSILQSVEVDFTSEDFGRIDLCGLDYLPAPDGVEIEQRSLTADFGRIYTGRTTAGDMLLYNQTNTFTENGVVGTMTDRVADAVRSSVNGDNAKKKKSFSWEFGGGDLNFAWGWHNWGNAMFTGFGGVDGAAEVGTTFNNIQLHLNWTIARNRWLGFYAGLGLEWDKWKFATPCVTLNTAVYPYAFADAGAISGSMSLTTRYVIVPLTIRLGDTDGVHLELSAIPGIHWNASGLRSKEIVGNRTETVKDRSINKLLNPYKFDLRASLYYRHIGIYAQFSTQSVFKGNCEELFPVKFGFII